MSDNPIIRPYGNTENIGRPTKFTPERRAAIIRDISRRAPYEFAAEANGICEDTLYEWIKIGKKHRREGIDSDYADFSENIKKAEMERLLEHVDKITANVDRWQADAWMLERRWHKHYGSNATLNELNLKLDKLLESEPQHGQERKELEEG